MKIKPEICHVLCDFSHSKISIHYSNNHAIPGCEIPIDVSHMTISQKSATAWKIAIAIKKSGISNVNVYFTANGLESRNYYQRTITRTMNHIFKFEKTVSVHISDKSNMEYSINEKIDKFTLESIQDYSTVASIINESLHYTKQLEYNSDVITDNVVYNTCIHNDYYFHCQIGCTSQCFETSLTRGIFDVHISIPMNAICEAYATITKSDDSQLTPTYPHKRMDILITAFDVYYKKTDSDKDCETSVKAFDYIYIYNDIANHVPLLGIFRNISDLLRERYESESGQKLDKQKYEKNIQPLYNFCKE